MANFSTGLMFPQAQAQQREIERQRKLAEALQAQSLASPETQSIGGVAIAQSPLEGLSRMLQGYVAKSSLDNLNQKETAAASQQQKQMADAITGSNIWINPDTSELALDEAQSKEMLSFQVDPEGYMKSKRLAEMLNGGGLGGDAKSLAAASVIYPELAPLATYTAGQEKQSKEQNTKVQEVTPPGFRVSEGVIPSADDAKKLKSLSEATTNLNRLMDELTDLYKQSGGAQPIGKNADLMRQKYEQAKIQVKNLEELGAIQAPDVPIIEGMIPNPANPIEYGKEQIGIVSIPERANAFKKELDNRVKTRAKTMGYEPLQLPLTPDPNLSGAMQAIQSGAPKDAVRQRLLQNGYSPEQLSGFGL